jgi:hypothetical protein
MKTFHGSCTCGAIKFEADIDLASGTTRCNCSFCKKARLWFAMAKQGAVRVTAGAEHLHDFQRKPASKPEPYLHFYFCDRCGVRPFSAGGGDLKSAEFYAVNLGALDDASDDELAAAPIKYADGAHDNWKGEPKVHSYL